VIFSVAFTVSGKGGTRVKIGQLTSVLSMLSGKVAGNNERNDFETLTPFDFNISESS
jgi:hypothetical protein